MERRAFTLIELIVTIAILALVATAALVSIRTIRKRADYTAAYSTMVQIQKMLYACHISGGTIESMVSVCDGQPDDWPQQGYDICSNSNDDWLKLPQKWHYQPGCNNDPFYGTFTFSSSRSVVGENCRIACTEIGCQTQGTTCY